MSICIDSTDLRNCNQRKTRKEAILFILEGAENHPHSRAATPATMKATTTTPKRAMIATTTTLQSLAAIKTLTILSRTNCINSEAV